MKILSTIKQIKDEIQVLRRNGKTIGLVPTMGALHNGHVSLVKQSVADNDITFVSVFVNPTQFNDKNDLAKYPRTLDADCELLKKNGAIYVFAPSVDEIYPKEDTRIFSFPPLDTVMEGIYRPGHFNGVCQIVSKLFDIVTPDKAYFGEKDFQQMAIIREMVKQLNLNVKIVSCPIVREESGLALSSRNSLLSSEEKNVAVNISMILKQSVEFAKEHSLAETKEFVEESINNINGFKLEYFEIVDGNRLNSLSNWDDSEYIVGCITVYCGDVRLIDNIKYKV